MIIIDVKYELKTEENVLHILNGLLLAILQAT